LRDALTAAQFGDAVLTTQAILHDADLLFCGILFACCTFDTFDDLLVRALTCISHLPIWHRDVLKIVLIIARKSTRLWRKTRHF